MNKSFGFIKSIMAKMLVFVLIMALYKPYSFAEEFTYRDLNGTINAKSSRRITILGTDGNTYEATHDENTVIKKNGKTVDDNGEKLTYRGLSNGMEVYVKLAYRTKSSNRRDVKYEYFIKEIETYYDTKLGGLVKENNNNNLVIDVDGGKEHTFPVANNPTIWVNGRQKDNNDQPFTMNDIEVGASVEIVLDDTDITSIKSLSSENLESQKVDIVEINDNDVIFTRGNDKSYKLPKANNFVFQIDNVNRDVGDIDLAKDAYIFTDDNNNVSVVKQFQNYESGYITAINNDAITLRDDDGQSHIFYTETNAYKSELNLGKRVSIQAKYNPQEEKNFIIDMDNYESHINLTHLEGIIKSVSNSKLELESMPDEKMYYLDILEDAYFRLDDEDTNVKSFRKDMEVYIELRSGKVSLMESYSTDNPGYIMPGTKMVIGTVKYIDKNQVNLKLPTGKEEIYFMPQYVPITKNKIFSSVDRIYAGDRLKLYFDEYDSKTASRIVIDSDSVQISGLYSGVLKLVDDMSDEIVFENLKRYKNGEWEEENGLSKLELSDKFPVYMGGNELGLDWLKHYRGKTAYIAMEDFFSTQRIKKMVLKNNFEVTYDDAAIETLNMYTQSVELNNKRNVVLDDGTMIIKNDRIVDPYAINFDDSALVIADRTSSSELRGDVLYVHDNGFNPNNSGNYQLYAGELEEIFKEKIVLDDFFILQNNEWYSFDDEKELFIDDETAFYDMEEEELISREEFYASNYSVDDDSDYAEDRNLDDYYGYIYTNGDRVVAVGITEDLGSLNAYRTTTAKVESIKDDELVGAKAKFYDARDWSRRNDRWMPKSASLNVILDEATIIRDNKVIKPSELRVNETVYMIRDGAIGYVLIVK